MILAEYTGMSVKALEALRIEVDKVDGKFHVTKNTLLQLALEEANITVPENVLNGQLATGFALEEAQSLAKTLVDFAAKEQAFNVKGGFLGKDFVTAEQIEALAKMPSLDQLRAQLIGLINAPAQNVAGVIAGGVRQVVNVIDAYAKLDEAAEAA
jgi:large subunit ribosomal protein L10